MPIPTLTAAQLKHHTLRLLPWAISAWALWSVYHQHPLGDTWSAVKQSRLDFVAAAFAGTLLMHLLASWRLALLMDAQGCRLGLWQLFEINLVVFFYRLFLPGGAVTAGAVRLYKYLQVDRSLVQMLSALLLDRLLATAGLMLIGCACWVLDQPPLPAHIGWVLFLPFAITAALCATMLFSVGASLTRALQALLTACRLPALAQKLDSWIRSLGKFRELPPHRFILVLLLTVLSQFIGILTFAWLAHAVGIDLTVRAWGWVRPLIVLPTMLPISVAGLGVRDGAVMHLLGYYGVDQPQALALSLLVFGVTVLAVALLGGVLEGASLFAASAQRKRETAPAESPRAP